jgi:hypothetical protein
MVILVVMGYDTITFPGYTGDTKANDPMAMMAFGTPKGSNQ